MKKKQQTKSASHPGAPPSPAVYTETWGHTTVRVFRFPDSTYRITLDTLIKEDGDQKIWKHRQVPQAGKTSPAEDRNIESLFQDLGLDDQQITAILNAISKGNNN